MKRFARAWPWIVIALAIVPAFWHTLDFEEDLDDEFPSVTRPTFNRRPPPAYRLAEPGDTIDRVAIYLSSVTVVCAVAGLTMRPDRRGLWPAALGLAAGAFWYAATPGPTFDGWHGLGWRTIANRDAPIGTRLALAGAAVGLSALVMGTLLRARPRWDALLAEGRARGVNGLLLAAVVFVVCRQFEIPGIEPVGYWPRWAFDWGLIAFNLALLRVLPPLPVAAWYARIGLRGVGAAAWFALVVAGIWVTWYHRPLARLKTVVPGRIYLSAMPTGRGLAIAQARHHFKTIINLFPEETPQRSPRLPEELRFAREHGIRYVGSPSNVLSSNDFLDQTLAIAQDPTAWPILVHCHGCMDRSPAWMGIYRFVVEGTPLADIMREIERHRGHRPKASVTLLYNRVLPPRAWDRYRSDPAAALLQRSAYGTRDPALDLLPAEQARANPAEPARVEPTREPGDTRPNLTPGRGSLEYPETSHDRRPHELASPS